ncbi:MAG: hypothetical protein ACI4SN_02820 [Lachnospiraceae bacterium]
MLIQTIDGKYIDLDTIKESRLPSEEENYKHTANEFYGKDRPTKPKQDKNYNYFNIKKQLENKGLTLVNITSYKGNRYSGYNTYQVSDTQGNILIKGYLPQIAVWMEEKGME